MQSDYELPPFVSLRLLTAASGSIGWTTFDSLTLDDAMVHDAAVIIGHHETTPSFIRFSVASRVLDLDDDGVWIPVPYTSAFSAMSLAQRRFKWIGQISKDHIRNPEGEGHERDT
jgi:hypothetical protein